MNNFAYNFEVFEEKKAKKSGHIVKLPDKKQRLELKKREKFLFWLKLTVNAFIISVIIGGFVFGQAIVAEYTHRASVCAKELEEIESRNDQLEMRLVSQNFSNNNSFDCNSKNISFRPVEQIIISAGDVIELN